NVSRGGVKEIHGVRDPEKITPPRRSLRSRRPSPSRGGWTPSAWPALILEPHDLLALLAQPLDAERDHVAGLEPYRRWLHAEGYARRRAGGDDVARLQHEELRAVPDDVRDAEDHGLRVAALALLAVDVEPHVELLHVLDLVLGDEPGPERPERLAALALGPLAAALLLELPLRHVVADAVAGDHVERVLLGEVARARPDHDRELVVELGRGLRDHGVVVCAHNAVRRLLEDDRVLRDRRARLGGVVGV